RSLRPSREKSEPADPRIHRKSRRRAGSFFLKRGRDAIRLLEPTAGNPPPPARRFWRSTFRPRTGLERRPRGDRRPTRRLRAAIAGRTRRAPRDISLRPAHVLRLLGLACLRPIRGSVALVGSPNGLFPQAAGREAHVFLAQPLRDFLCEGRPPA